jgi:putative FmdB family regulatory protein
MTMPIHDFVCTECKARFELLVRTGSPAQCPTCSSLKLEKQIAAIAPVGRSAGIISSARAQARREGHLSNY